MQPASVLPAAAPPVPTATPIRLGGALLLADASGALVWPAMGTVVVADLHFEKGSSLAARGLCLPPYDTRATLARLAEVVTRTAAQRIICLGDSFHDAAAAGRLAAEDRGRLAALVAGREWHWVCGNHDPLPPAGLGGRAVAEALDLGGLVFRHEATPGRPAGAGEVSGHFHPVARVRLRAGSLRGRCFVAGERRLVLPAFGAYAGGLDAGDPAIAGLFPEGYEIHLIGRGRVARLPASLLDPPPRRPASPPSSRRTGPAPPRSA